MSMCISYSAMLNVIDEVSQFHAAPLKKWIEDGIVFKFWGDNVDKQQKVRDFRSDHQATMLHMYSIVVGRKVLSSLTVSSLTEVPAEFFLPTCDDVKKLKDNLVVLVSRVLVSYFPQLAPEFPQVRQ